MITYIEDEEGWSYQMDLETKKVVPGEYRFVTFTGSPAVEYTSGAFRGTRTYGNKQEVIDKFAALGFVEVLEEPKNTTVENKALTAEQTQWLVSQLEPNQYLELVPGQVMFSLENDRWLELLSEMKARQI